MKEAFFKWPLQKIASRGLYFSALAIVFLSTIVLPLLCSGGFVLILPHAFGTESLFPSGQDIFLFVTEGTHF